MKLNVMPVRYSIAAIVCGTNTTQLSAMDGVAVADDECFPNGCNNFRLSSSTNCTVPAKNIVIHSRNTAYTWICGANDTTPAPIMKATGPLAFAKGSAANKMRFKCTEAGLATVAALAASNRNCFVSVDIDCNYLSSLTQYGHPAL